MAIHRGSSIPKLAPTVVINAVTEFNQNQGTFNATVSANGYSTTTFFDYSTSAVFATFTTVVSTAVTGQAQSISTTVTGLSNGTLYYVRCRATNALGTTTSTGVSFTTWSLKTYLNTTAGAYSVSVPSITGVAPVLTEILLYGGGGGANYGGGGGGGYRLASTHTSSTTGTQNVTGTVGAAGTGGNGGGGAGGATAGGNTTNIIGSTTRTAGGGTPGVHPGSCGSPVANTGNVGTGDNPAYVGGNNSYGYYTVISQTCVAYDKFGFCTQYVDNYGYDCAYYAGGGGGGTDGNGTNAGGLNSNSQTGGNGGNGGGAYGLNGGSGGGGQGTQGNGTQGTVVGGGTTCGRGGSVFAAGTAGGVTFKYFGP